MYVPFANSSTNQQGIIAIGGDVTINNGIITVNDDSHNHIIDNVDGLQAALNEKLDKSGGWIYNANAGSDTPLYIRADATESYIGYWDKAGTALGYLGFDADHNPRIYTTSGGYATVIHSNNYGTYAVPIAGGTMTGKLRVDAPIFGYNYKNNIHAPAFIFDKQGTNYTGIGAGAELDTILFAPVSDDAWVSDYYQKWKFQGDVIADRNIYVGSNAVIHAGNIGSQSVHSADVLTINNTENKSAGRLQFFQVNNNTDISPATAAALWWHVIRCQHAGYTNGYWRDLAFDFFSNDIKTRKNQDGVLGSWATLISSDNIGSQHVASARILAGTSESTITTHPGVAQMLLHNNIVSTLTGLFPTSNNANAVLTINRHSGHYDSQLGFSANGNMYYRSFNGSALDSTTGWKTVIDSGNYSSYALPKSGGTLTGTITFDSNTFSGGDKDALNLNNGNIVGVNRLKLADSANAATEGIIFPRDDGATDAIRAYNGTFYFNQNGTDRTVIHSGNIGSQIVAGFLSPNEYGVKTDQYGNLQQIKHTSGACWQVVNSSGTAVLSVYFDGSEIRAGTNTVIHSGNISSYVPSFSYLNGVLTIS